MIRILATILVAFSLAGCAQLQKIQQVYTFATTTTVPAEDVRAAANAFDILKGTAVNFARYCIASNNTAAGCDVNTRRIVSKAVRSGTSARIQLRASLATNQPALASVYNLLISAVNDLKASPVNGFTGG